MTRHSGILSQTFKRFLASEQAGGLLLVACTVLALLLANSSFGEAWSALWQYRIGPLSLALWVNDALMAVFFLLIGLELERELYVGELADVHRALLPIVAALGGMLAPALVHYAFNAGSPTQPGFGIPMATDIAFAMGALAMLGQRIPNALKVFVVAFAVMDDLGAIVVIAAFYTPHLALGYLLLAMAVWLVLIVLNRRFRIMVLWPYLIGGLLLWIALLKSGVHATLSGVLLAFAIPFSHRDDDHQSPSHRLEHALHRPVAFLVLPIFALANTGIAIDSTRLDPIFSANSLGIFAGLVAGKPLGIVLACLLAVTLGICRLPEGVRWKHVIGAGMLGGIGFTMSIFIANLAFDEQPTTIDAAKLAVLAASLCAGVMGILWLMATAKGRFQNPPDARYDSD